MELRRLSYFLAVAEELHFGRAASRLHIAQPSLSQQIRALEAELHAELLERGSRPIRLTAAGRALSIQGRELLQASQRLEQEIRDVAAGRRGELRISLNRSLAGGIAAALIERYRNEHPYINVTLRVAYSRLQIDQLRAGDLDAAFVHSPLGDLDRIGTVNLGTEPVVAALPAGSSLARRRALRRCDIVNERLVWWPSEDNPQMSLDLLRQLYGDSSPHIARIEPDEEHLLYAVAEGAGITFISAGRAQTLKHPGVRYRPLWTPPPATQLSFAWMESRQSAPLRDLVHLARRYAVNT